MKYSLETWYLEFVLLSNKIIFHRSTCRSSGTKGVSGDENTNQKNVFYGAGKSNPKFGVVLKYSEVVK